MKTFKTFEDAKDYILLKLITITGLAIIVLIIAIVIGVETNRVDSSIMAVGGAGALIHSLFGPWFNDFRVAYAFYDRYPYMGITDEASSSVVLDGIVLEIAKIGELFIEMLSFDGKIICVPVRMLIDDFKIEKSTIRNVRVDSREMVVMFPVVAHFEINLIRFKLISKIRESNNILLPENFSGESSTTHTDFYLKMLTTENGVKNLFIEVTTNGGELRLEKEAVPNFLDSAFNEVLREVGLDPAEIRITPTLVK